MSLTDAQRALAAELGLDLGLVEAAGTVPPFNKNKKPASGPAGNQKKQLKEFPFGLDAEAKPGEDNDKPGGATGDQFGNQNGQFGGPSDETVKQMQQQQADRERAEMEARAAADAEDEAERLRLKEIRAEAEEEVADDLNDKYSDKKDSVEFYPKMESFMEFIGNPLQENFKSHLGYSTKFGGSQPPPKKDDKVKKEALVGATPDEVAEAQGTKLDTSAMFKFKSNVKPPVQTKAKTIECPQCEGEGTDYRGGNCSRCGGGGKIDPNSKEDKVWVTRKR